MSKSNPIPQARFHSVKDVADHLSVSTKTVYRLIKGGGLIAVRVGRQYRITERDLQDYLRGGSLL